MAHVALLAFGLASSLALLAVGLARAVARRYRDRTGATRTGAAAVRAGLLVAIIGACELLLTVWLFALGR
jgi:hypothetical protein